MIQSKQIAGGSPVPGTGMATVTTAELHVYANGTSGNDANDGLTVSTPKLTLDAVFALVPDIVKHNTCVHLAGTFNEPGYVYLTKYVNGVMALVIDGGDSWTVVDDNGGNKYAAIAGSSVSQLVVASTPWTTDQRFGYVVRVLTGTAAGQMRSVYSNSTNTLVVQADFSPAPAVGDTFDIVRPTTTISASTNSGGITIFRSTGQFYVQRLYLSGTKATLGAYESSTLIVASVVSDSTYNYTIDCGRATNVTVSSYIKDTSQTNFPTSTLHKICVALRAGRITACWMINAFLTHLLAKNLKLISVQYLWLGGCRILGPCTWSDVYSGPESIFTNGRQTQISNPAGVGISAYNSQFAPAAGGLSVSSCAGHGIELNHSMFKALGDVQGSGNTGAGVYAHNCSVVNIKHGAAPTLTGTVGDLAITSPTVQESTWAAIDAGTPVAIAAEMTMAKEVV